MIYDQWFMMWVPGGSKTLNDTHNKHYNTLITNAL